jgi:hypothetical protein
VDAKGNDLRKAAATSPPASAVPSSPTPQVSPSSATFPPGQWVKVFTKLEDLPPALRSRQTSGMKDGWIKAADSAEQLHLPPQLTGNYALRAHFRHRANNKLASYLNLRVHGPERERYQLFLSDGGFLSLQSQRGGKFSILTSLQSQRDLKPGETFQLSLGIVGSRLVTRLGSELVSSHVDVAHASGPGFLHLQDDVRDIEVINLDGLSEAEALKILGVDEKGNDLRKAAATSPPASAVPSSPTPQVSPSSATFPPGQWVKVFTKFEDLPTDLRQPESGVKFEGGWIRFTPGKPQRIPLVTGMTNCGIRAKIERLTEKPLNRSVFILRSDGTNNSQYYRLYYSDHLLVSSKQVQGDSPYLFQAPVRTPLNGVGEYTMEFAVAGTRLIGRFGSETVRVARGADLTGGVAYITGEESIRDIEVINLDGLPEAEALRILGVDEKGNDLRAAAVVAEKQQMEQAKAADAMAAIPELKALHEQFVKFTAERVTAPFDAEVAKLNAGYVGGIDREIASEKKAGHLDGVIALEAEKKLIADKQPVPAADDATTPEALKKLRGIYRTAYAKIEAARAENLKALTDPLDVRLKQLEATLTQQDRVTHAKTVREYRENLGKEGSAGIPSGAGQPASNTATTMNGADSTADEGEKLSAKEVVEWALGHRAHVIVFKSGEYLTIQSANQIPKGSFEVTELDFAKAPEPRSQITDAELEKLAGLKELRQLQLQWRKGFEGSFLAKLTGLRKLTYVTLSDTSFDASHLPLLSLLPSLETLRCDASLINEGGDKLPKRLKTLAVHGSPSLELLMALRGYRELSGLKAINFPLTVAQAEVIAQLQGLSSLEIGFSEDPAILSELSQLPRLNMLIFSSTSFAIPTLAGLKQLPDLRHLRLTAEIVQKDPAGFISILAELKKLERVELMTNPAFAAQAHTLQETLQKALPKIKVSVL